MQTDPDASLVTQAFAGDLNALVRRHQSWIFNLALRIIWRRDLAED
jgi:hypothetical protein